MALSVDSTTNLNLIDAAEATTGWSFSGITKTATSTASREGTNCVGGQVALNSFGYAWHTHGSSVDMTVSGNERVYIWVNSIGAGTAAQDGWMVLIGDGTNRRAYRVGGSDDVPFAVKGWYCLMLDTANLPANYQQQAGSAQPTLSAITQFGFGIYNVVAPSGNALNVFVDVVRYGSGIIVTSGASDDIDLADIAADDFSSATGKAYGIIREIQPGVYGIQGDILFGDTAGNSIDYKESDAVVIFEDRVRGTGTNTAFKFSGQHSATGTFSVELGTVVSSGDSMSGRNGNTFVNANPANQPVDFDFSDSDIETVLLYGCSFLGLQGTIAFSADATNGPNHDIAGCTFSNCSQVALGRVFTRNCSFIGYTPDTDGALLWNANIDIKNCSFLGNTDGTNDPHAIEHDTAGTFSYSGMTFSGNDYDINNSASATVVDSYQPTEDGDVDVYSGSITRVAQQFTGTAGDLSRAIFSIRKQGTPTGSVYAKLYANSGGAPTGSPLATSKAVDIAGLGTSFADVDFEFEDEYTLVASTEYHISIEYTGGDSSNRLEVEYLTAGSGSEACNTYVSSWSGQTYDCRFQVNRDGIVKINATESDPGTAEETATTKGATIIVNTVTLKITVKEPDGTAIVGAKVSIHTDDEAQTELMNEDTIAGGIAQEDYNYTGDQAIFWRVRDATGGNASRRGGGTIESTGFTAEVTLTPDIS